MTEGLALALVVGIVVSMPVGPTATLCIRQSFAHGMTAGMLTAMGAAVPDAVYAAEEVEEAARLFLLLRGPAMGGQALGGQAPRLLTVPQVDDLLATFG